MSTTTRKARIRYSPEEDELLVRLVNDGTSFEEIAADHLPNRSASALQQRFTIVSDMNAFANLQLAKSTAAGKQKFDGCDDFTQAEQTLIWDLIAKGLSFKDIAAFHLPARSANAVETQYRKMYSTKKLDAIFHNGKATAEQIERKIKETSARCRRLKLSMLHAEEELQEQEARLAELKNIS